MKDYLKYIDAKRLLTFPDVKILLDSDDGYLLFSQSDGFINTASFNENGAKKIISLLPPNAKIVCARGEDLLPLLLKKGLEIKDECYQAEYHGKKLNLPKSAYAFRALNANDFDSLKDFYANPDYVYSLLEKGVFLGAFEGENLVGAIGEHARGSMGLLFVHPRHRKKGLGYLIEGAKINALLESEKTPFCHIVVTNSPSIALQKKLGLTFLEEKVYWLK